MTELAEYWENQRRQNKQWEKMKQISYKTRLILWWYSTIREVKWGKQLQFHPSVWESINDLNCLKITTLNCRFKVLYSILKWGHKSGFLLQAWLSIIKKNIDVAFEYLKLLHKQL